MGLSLPLQSITSHDKGCMASQLALGRFCVVGVPGSPGASAAAPGAAHRPAVHTDLQELFSTGAASTAHASRSATKRFVASSALSGALHCPESATTSLLTATPACVLSSHEECLFGVWRAALQASRRERWSARGRGARSMWCGRSGAAARGCAISRTTTWAAPRCARPPSPTRRPSLSSSQTRSWCASISA